MLCVGMAALGAQEAEVAPLRIEDARCDPTFAGAVTGSCTLVIRNPGRTADRLVTIATRVADRVEIHSMSVTDGIMQMRRLAQGVDIAAGSSVDFHARGYHLMLVGLAAPLTVGATFDATLSFERAGAEQIHFRVEERREGR